MGVKKGTDLFSVCGQNGTDYNNGNGVRSLICDRGNKLKGSDPLLSHKLLYQRHLIIFLIRVGWRIATQ